MTTDDGFILSVQRIPKGRNGRGGSGKGKPPVIIQHGVLVVSSSIIFDPLFSPILPRTDVGGSLIMACIH